MIYGYKSILSSPHFLVFTEPGLASAADGANLRSPKLDDYAVANRLAYFLWSGPPDDELLAAARRGELDQAGHAAGPGRADARAIPRPTASPRTSPASGSTCGKINATIPDPRLYGDFDGVLLWSMPRESHLVFEEILKHDRSLLEFVDADWSMLNERLADHYGIPGVEGNEFRKVALPAGSHRGGVLTQASVLKVTADGTRTSPVLRGQVGARKDPRPAAGPAAAGRAGDRARHPRRDDDPPAARQAPRHRVVRVVPRPHRSAGLRPGSLRPDRRLPRFLPRHRRATASNALQVAFQHRRPRIFRGPDVEQGAPNARRQGLPRHRRVQAASA